MPAADGSGILPFAQLIVPCDALTLVSVLFAPLCASGAPQGFHDEEYKQRRSSLADLAKTHVM